MNDSVLFACSFIYSAYIVVFNYFFFVNEMLLSNLRLFDLVKVLAIKNCTTVFLIGDYFGQMPKLKH